MRVAVGKPRNRGRREGPRSNSTRSAGGADKAAAAVCTRVTSKPSRRSLVANGSPMALSSSTTRTCTARVAFHRRSGSGRRLVAAAPPRGAPGSQRSSAQPVLLVKSLPVAGPILDGRFRRVTVTCPQLTFDPTYAPHSGRHRRPSVISRPGPAAAARGRRGRNSPRRPWLRGLSSPSPSPRRAGNSSRHRAASPCSSAI